MPNSEDKGAWEGFRTRNSGDAGVVRYPSGLRLICPPGSGRSYRNAQIDDYSLVTGTPLLHRPPLQMTIWARFSSPAGSVRGTAGFGFWNYPWAWPPALPQALWFFYGAPPHNMPLANGVAGAGWKAATIDAGRPAALAWLPLAPLVVPLLHLPWLSDRLWFPIQRAVGVAEVSLPLDIMNDWHQYRIEWESHTCRLLVDDHVILTQSPAPRGPLSFVAWIDNQYLILTPRGKIGWGLHSSATPQWMEIDISISDLQAHI
jgi:hypothetical protein